MGFSTVVIVGGFVSISAIVSSILENKKRKDLAQLLNLLVKLALMGIAAYLFFDIAWMIINSFGGFPRI